MSFQLHKCAGLFGRFLGLLMLLMLPCPLALAQPKPQYDAASAGLLPIRVYTDKDGLPQNSVEAILFDAKDYLWIATQDGGEAESSRSVKLKIHKLIQSEDPKNPLSDQEIADILAKEGLDISRRTVTKYRIVDGIPSTRQRRTF